MTKIDKPSTFVSMFFLSKNKKSGWGEQKFGFMY